MRIHCENPLRTSNVCPGQVSDPFMNHLGKGVRIVLIVCCRGVKKVLAFPLEGLKYNDFHCWQELNYGWKLDMHSLAKRSLREIR